MAATLKIKSKLILAFLLIGLIPVILIGYIANNRIETALTNKAYEQLNAVSSLKKIQVENRLARLRRDILGLANSEFVYNAYLKLLAYHNNPLLGPANPLVDGYNVVNSEYEDIWQDYGQPISNFAKSYGYDEVYMICKAHGHVMYSSTKGKDMGTNLRAGSYKDSGLAKLWQIVSETEQVAIVDFEPYEAEDGSWTSFIGAPIRNPRGEMIGLVVFKVPYESLASIVYNRAGMGQTGNSFIAGKVKDEIALRTDIDTITKLKPEIKMGHIFEYPCINEAFESHSASGYCNNFYDTRILFDSEKIDFLGLDWIVVSTINQEEALNDVIQMRYIIIIVALVLVLSIILVGYLMASGLSMPIKSMTAAMNKLAQGNLQDRKSVV